MLEDNKYPFRMYIDHDKNHFQIALNIAMNKYAPKCGHFSDLELDACIDYYEMRDQKWLSVISAVRE